MNNLSNIEKLNQFLLNHYVEKDAKCFTHVEFCPGMGRGRYYISDGEYPIFFELYQKALEDKNNLKIVESPKTLSPLKIDFDFRFEEHYSEHQYTQDDIKNIIKAYLVEVDKYLDIDNSLKKAFVYEIPEPVVDNSGKTITYKDGIHIMFPDIVTKPNVQYIIRDNIIAKFENIIDKDKINYINTPNDIVDKAIIKSAGWVMYGSSKPGRKPYSLTKIYGVSTNDENIVDDDINLEEHDINTYSLEQIIKLSSIHNKDVETKIKDEKITEIEDYGGKKSIKELNRDKKLYNKKTEDPQVISRYLDMLLPFRYEEYNSWVEIGLALYNIGNGSDEYLEIWDTFSRKSQKYQSGCCERKWKSFTLQENLLNIGSIRYWAQMDNRIEYIHFTYELGIFNDKIAKCVAEPYDYDIAQVITNLYNGQFIYEPNNMEWYYFTEHKWKCIKKEPLPLLNYISTDIVELFLKYIKRVLVPDWQNKENLEDKKNAGKNIERIFKVIEKKCKDNKPKESIIKESKIGFMDDTFLAKADSPEYKHLICFTNGIYDLREKAFRNGRPCDFITMCTNYDYINYDAKNPIFQEIEDFIVSIQPDITQDDTERREYLKAFLSSILQGVNTDESFHIFTGGGRNGKSKIIELLESALGDYAGKLNISSITKPRKNSSDATPDQVTVRNKRLVTMQESDPNDKFNNGILKEVSGGDKMTARGLYKEPITFKPQYKQIVICNDIPQLQNPTDSAVFERVRVIEFPMHFIRGKCTDRYERKMDVSISDKIEKWGPYFMTLLIKWFHEYFPNNEIKLKPPHIVNKYTNEYKNNNDKWNDFYQTTINVTNTKNNDDIIDIRSDIYSHFKEWCKENELKVPGFLEGFKSDFQRRFKISGDKIKRNKIIGWKAETIVS